MSIPHKILFLLAGCLLLAGAAGATEAPGEKPVAVGDGFVLTRAEVAAFQEFVEQQRGGRRFASTWEQHRKAALKHRLFFVEAKAIGLDREFGLQPEDLEGVKNEVRLATLYMGRVLLEETPLREHAVESYYRAHPESIQGELDDDMREKIRRKILNAKSRPVSNETFERLMRKYHVRVLDPQTGKYL